MNPRWNAVPPAGSALAALPPQRPSLRRRRLLAASVAACGLALPPALQAKGPPTGQAPDFTLRTLEGVNLRLKEQRGRVVLLNFWATWCAPCRIEMPHLNKLYDKYRATGFVLLGVNVDDDARNAAGVAAKLGVRFPVLLDTDKKVSRLYDLQSMPSTLLIDRDGKVRALHRGYREGYENQYEQQIRELLKE